MNAELSTGTLPDIVTAAWADGRKIDLDGIGYGRVHWGNKSDVLDTPNNYYYFLAGLVRRYGFTRILEIGTHWGGATRAMRAGVKRPEDARIVTVDISTESDNRLKDYPDIVKIVGDANTAPTLWNIIEAFDGQPVDLVYIDADHHCFPTIASVAFLSLLLRPKLIVLDDISFNEDMQAAWKMLQAALPEEDMVDVHRVVREIRPEPKAGFGMIRLSQNLAARDGSAAAMQVPAEESAPRSRWWRRARA